MTKGELLQHVHQARAERDRADEELYDRILDALDAGVSITYLAQAAGYSREGIYQIKRAFAAEKKAT